MEFDFIERDSMITATVFFLLCFRRSLKHQIRIIVEWIMHRFLSEPF